MPGRPPSWTLEAQAIYPVRHPLTTQRFEPGAFDPIEGYTLAMYAEVCRALVRWPGSSTRQLETALAEHGLTADLWGRIRAGWSARIASDPFVRGAFRRMYSGEVSTSPVIQPEGGTS